MTNFLERKSLKMQIKQTCTYNYFVSSIICIYYYTFLIIIVVCEQIYFQHSYANCSEIILLKNRVPLCCGVVLGACPDDDVAVLRPCVGLVSRAVTANFHRKTTHL